MQIEIIITGNIEICSINVHLVLEYSSFENDRCKDDGDGERTIKMPIQKKTEEDPEKYVKSMIWKRRSSLPANQLPNKPELEVRMTMEEYFEKDFLLKKQLKDQTHSQMQKQRQESVEIFVLFFFVKSLILDESEFCINLFAD